VAYNASNSTWGNVDITATFNQPAPATGSILTSFSSSATQNFVYFGTSGDVLESVYTMSSGAWGSTDVNSKSAAPAPVAATCSGVSPGWLGSTTNGPTGFAPSVTLENSDAGIDFLVYGENQTVGSATVLQGQRSIGNLGSTGGTWTVQIPSSTFSTLGSYAVVGRIHGTTTMCSPPSFFDIVTPVNNLPPQLTPVACGNITGSWVDPGLAGSPTGTWALSQNGTSVTGQVTSTVSGCSTVTWGSQGVSLAIPRFL
jgi:hypothetical protein